MREVHCCFKYKLMCSTIKVSSDLEDELDQIENAWLWSQRLINLSLTADVQHIQITLGKSMQVTSFLPCLIHMHFKLKDMMHAMSCVSS